jgi:hypothetical protein
MVAPEVHARVVLGDLIADLVAPLLAVALQFLSVLDAAGTIVGHILGACTCRTGSNTGCADAWSGNARCNTSSGRKLRRADPATALQELACGAASTWPGAATCPHSAGRSTRDIQELIHLAGRRPGAGCDIGSRSARGNSRPSCSTGAGRRPRCRARSGRRPRCGARSTCGPRPAATYRRRTTGRGRGPRPATSNTTAAATTTSTTASKDVVLHENKGRSDEYQESHYTFHVITFDLF